MEINSIILQYLHNEEHFQFHRELKELVELSGAQPLNVESDFDSYKTILQQEEEALNLVRKSATTGEIEQADKERDTLVRGMVDTVKSQLKHFNAEKQAAAERFKIVLDQYGDIPNKPYDDETAAIHKLVLESKTTYANDVSTLGLTEWMAAIEAKNNAFQELKKDRNTEESQKTLLRMKTVRLEVDAAYKKIVKRINALITINGLTVYETFVRELNSRIDKANNTLAQRRGRNKKNGSES